MARATFVKKARKAVPAADIKVGDSYYWWKFRFGGKHYSKTPPKQSQLTQSAFYSTLYDIQERAGDLPADDGLPSERDSIVSDLEDLKSECESSLENVPDSLKEAPTGQLLQERIDALDSAIGELEGIDMDDEPNEDNREDWADEHESLEDAVSAYWEEKRDEVSNVDLGIA